MTAVASPTPAAPANPLDLVLSKLDAQGGQISAIADAQKATDNRLDTYLKSPDYAKAGGTPGDVRGPTIRTGENIMGSRGFSLTRLFGAITGQTGFEQAKVEMDIAKQLHDKLIGATPGAEAFRKVNRHTVLAPLCSGYLPEDMVGRDFMCEMKSLIRHGVYGADPENTAWMQRKMYEKTGNPQWLETKDLSWLNESLGGALVEPPEQGELIQLLRNKEALVRAGARTIPLPPQGRLVYPRQTSPGTAAWLGENTQIASSTVGTGEVVLSAKKLAVLMKVPNELIRFASPAAEALLRDDMTKDLALTLDLAGLEGTGSSNQPLGIINHPNVTLVTSSTTGTNGDTIVPQDVYKIIYNVEELNAEFEGWIMRPKTLFNYYMQRSSVLANNDEQGLFVFNLTREAGDAARPTLAGYPVTKSTQVSRTRVKSGGTTLTYIVGGMWSDLLIGMFGAMEFSATALGDTSFQNDQTWVRGILTADIKPRHEAAFAYMDNLVTL